MIPKLNVFFRTPKIRRKYKNALNRANRRLRVFIKRFGETTDKHGTLILSPSDSVQPTEPDFQGILDEGLSQVIDEGGSVILGE